MKTRMVRGSCESKPPRPREREPLPSGRAHCELCDPNDVNLVAVVVAAWFVICETAGVLPREGRVKAEGMHSNRSQRFRLREGRG